MAVVFRHQRTFQQTLLRWFGQHGRDLPWRRTRSAYHILVSEIMLQQTQVDHVIPKYHQFLERFPTAEALANASSAEVIRAWSGLGYNRRCLNLQRTARIMVQKYGGGLPETFEDLLALPGIGPYTAGALLAFVHHKDQATLDTNIRRVIHRYFLGPEVPRLRIPEKRLLEKTQTLIPPQHGWAWNHGLMDFGALICTAKNPACDRCPLFQTCASGRSIHAAIRKAASNRVKKQEPAPRSTPNIPNRIYRGRIVELLRQHEGTVPLVAQQIGKKVKPDYSSKEWRWLKTLLNDLRSDGLIQLQQKTRQLIIKLP